MRLSDYIMTGMEDIVVEWEKFAATLYPPNSRMTATGLRDHGEAILRAIAADLRTEQSDAKQALKSKGLADQPAGAPESPAQTHAILRAQSGIDINQLASEYRALRASVLRLWGENCDLDKESLQDVIRFNEAIDQALAESISFFNSQVEQSRNLLLGMLGHDMRNPLNAIVLTTQELADLDAGEEVAEAASSLMLSGVAMSTLLDDLLLFSRRRMGLGISIVIGPADLGAICTNEIRMHRAAHPQCHVELTLDGDLNGQWDGARLHQVLRNLLSNATHYGAGGDPVKVTACAHGDEIRLDVMNTGPAIDAASAQRIFEPLQRNTNEVNDANRNGMGLGLYIVREITKAHGGQVKLHSEDSETLFSVFLPRITKASNRLG